MRKFIVAATIAAMTAPAFAGSPNDIVAVPEMGAGAGVAAVALLIGVAAIIREKSKRK